MVCGDSKVYYSASLIIIIIFIIIDLFLWEFFTPALGGGFLLEVEWLQVSSGGLGMGHASPT